MRINGNEMCGKMTKNSENEMKHRKAQNRSEMEMFDDGYVGDRFLRLISSLPMNKSRIRVNW